MTFDAEGVRADLDSSRSHPWTCRCEHLREDLAAALDRITELEAGDAGLRDGLVQVGWKDAYIGLHDIGHGTLSGHGDAHLCQPVYVRSEGGTRHKSWANFEKAVVGGVTGSADTGHTSHSCDCGHHWDSHMAVRGGCGFCSCTAHPPNQPNKLEVAEREHDWAEPQRTHVGWQTSCKSCTAWWSDPHAPSGPPDWMTTACSMTTALEGVVYPANVPSDTIDSPPRLAGEGT